MPLGRDVEPRQDPVAQVLGQFGQHLRLVRHPLLLDLLDLLHASLPFSTPALARRSVHAGAAKRRLILGALQLATDVSRK
jgi:hypothetical protein